MNNSNDKIPHQSENCHRKSPRLKSYDYSQPGFYFITICTQNRLRLFGNIDNAKMILTPAGLMINNIWQQIPASYQNMVVHECVVMPNHLHGIIQISAHSDQAIVSLSNTVHRFKTFTTTQYIKGVNDYKWPRFDKKLWQRGYHEHIIRNQEDYNRLSEYIQTNPLRWKDDRYFES